ncbi:MAG: CHAP domain-containing protein [Rhodospirillales bacterium]|nr:CHAP domain-containing protein [Rhodospirillales bacterium]MDE2197939.1 CHAP domain-containing protein [Rhodospirillales bacterium]MDE2576508.1 CHAP domain-containing protein [Rhodospirillales bacterium]
MSPILRMVSRFAVLLGAGALSACGAPSSRQLGPALAGYSYHPGLSCAPFARELSDIALYGDADTWWDQAAGRYRRGVRPEIGGVLVFRRSGRLPSGHVSVVSRILTPRQITVIQANWEPGELDEDQLIVDVSEQNDWSAVRVWYPPLNQLGAHVYAAYGFLAPPFPATHQQLLRAIRPAATYGLIDARGRPAPRARLVGG